MPRNLISQVVCDAEPMLGEVRSVAATRVWHPVFAFEACPLDTARWQTRAAHGLSWNRGGKIGGINR